MANASPPSFRGGEIRVRPPAALRALPDVPPVVLMPRRVPGGVLATLDALPARALPRLAYEGPASGIRRAMRATLAERLPRPRWLANWLLDDVLDHAALLTALSGASALRVSLAATLDGVWGGSDTPLALAKARRRLVTAYRGPGFQWLPPRAAAVLAGGEAPAPDMLRRLPRGDVALLRGDADGPGVAHRAVPAAGPDDAEALLLVIDEALPAGRTARAFGERRVRALQ